MAVAACLVSMLAVFFAIVGVQLLGGILGNHCYSVATGAILPGQLCQATKRLQVGSGSESVVEG